VTCPPQQREAAAHAPDSGPCGGDALCVQSVDDRVGADVERAARRDRERSRADERLRRLRQAEIQRVTAIREDVQGRRQPERRARVAGSGSLRVAGEMLPLRAGDVVFVPVSTPYEFWGETTYLVVNGPAFADGDDVYGELR
jgi:hypothetical protein